MRTSKPKSKPTSQGPTIQTKFASAVDFVVAGTTAGRPPDKVTKPSAAVAFVAFFFSAAADDDGILRGELMRGSSDIRIVAV